MNRENVDLVRDVLDHEIVDADGVPCGMVDDVELAGGPGGPLRIEGLVIGPGAWAERLPGPLARLARALGARGQTRIPWREVIVTADRIRLRSSAEDLGLGAADRRMQRWLSKVMKT
jgi:sporulation protein YlmC with PRC-barrel domain